MLLFFYAKGCPACSVARPEFEKFLAEHRMVNGIAVDADSPFVSLSGRKKIRATPLYVLRKGGETIAHEGVLKAGQIEKWLRTAEAILE